MKLFRVMFLIWGVMVYVDARCLQYALDQTPVLVDYTIWRGWHQALIYAVDRSNCSWALARLVKCLNLNGIAAAVNVCNSCNAKSRLGIIILTPVLMRNYTNQLSNTVHKIIASGLNTAFNDWLLIARSEYDITLINSVLNKTAIRFDQNIVAVFPSSTKISGEILRLSESHTDHGKKNSTPYLSNIIRYGPLRRCQNDYRSKDCVKNEFDRSYCSNHRQLNTTKSIRHMGLSITDKINARPFKMANATTISFSREFITWSQSLTANVSSRSGGVHILQYFKVRANSTLYASYLGSWLQGRSLSLVQVPYSVEERNFLGEVIIVGRSNSTGDGMGMDDETPDSPALLDDLLDFLKGHLNATTVMRYYNKLGFRTYEGIWTGLLGALMDSSVDIALEPVTALTLRYQDMDFVFPIVETMCNIYIRHQETSAVRDIFLAPFSDRLSVCVVAVAIVAAITVGVMSVVATQIIGEETRAMSCTEALLWSIGILCQQGGQWTPPIPAASVVLIVCLLFAVVTYNSYAAFITSVLSVRVPSVATVSDVLESSNFKIGYIRNGADQMYLMSTKDVQLNAFYIRGYSEAENLVTSTEEGLARAARQDYAFFTGQLAARSTLSKLSQARGRCALRELPVPSTRAQLAFPLPRRSPYARPILISLLHLRSNGALARLEAALVPPLPQCAPPSGFASARAADVRSALLLLLVGLLASLLIGKLRSTF